jgi:hypothetical protein
MSISTALSLRDARSIWVELGGTVTDVRRTGEERYYHASILRPITVNKRRKDAPRKLVTALRRIAGARTAA